MTILHMSVEIGENEIGLTYCILVDFSSWKGRNVIRVHGEIDRFSDTDEILPSRQEAARYIILHLVSLSIITSVVQVVHLRT